MGEPTRNPPLAALRAYVAAHAHEAIVAVEEPKKSCCMCWLDFPPAEVNEYDECIACYESVREEYGEGASQSPHPDIQPREDSSQ